MLDLVIDTNVLMHVDNLSEARSQSAKDFLVKFHASGVALCVDGGFNLIESQNRSVVGMEYFQHLVPGNLSYSILSDLAANKRIKIVDYKPSPQDSRKINRLVRKPHDRAFLKIAIGSEEKLLVSHDFVDFHDAARTQAHDEWEVEICTASDAHLKF